MWDCAECGCQAIAGSLDLCPQCYAGRDDARADDIADAPDEGEEVA